MFIYKNTSLATKTFYGVTFKPGEVKEVKGPINHLKFIRLSKLPKEAAAPATSTDDKKSDKSSSVKSNTASNNKQNSKDDKQGGNS